MGSFFTSSAFFWSLWGIELVCLLWWTIDEMRLQYLSVNPVVYFGWLWLGVALLLFLADARKWALIMVGIVGVPLAIMAVFLLAIMIASLFGPIRWN